VLSATNGALKAVSCCNNFDLSVFSFDFVIQTNSVAFSQQANYTDWATAICRRNLVQTFVDRGVSRGQRGGSPTVVNLSFLDHFDVVINF
jgi:hypothetical protein